MSISPNTQAILLLTSYFSKIKGDLLRPLTPKEWGRLELWLSEKSLTPEQLMTSNFVELLNGWSDQDITLGRLEALLGRGSALALAMEKWLRAGLWVMTNSDPDYPDRFKKRLRTGAPVTLYGCGNKALLNGGGLAVIGCRDANDEDLSYSCHLGALAAGEGYSIVSGGARGVDEAAMLGALEVEGTVIGVLADSLLRACSSIKYRKYLAANNLVLISTSYPEARFSVGDAMQRNKYIYCLSDSAVVVQSGMTGGTWNGARENLKNQWVPLWVKQSTDKSAGNSAIVKAGAEWVSANTREIDFTVLFSGKTSEKASGMDLFDQVESEAKHKESTDIPSVSLGSKPDSVTGGNLNSEFMIPSAPRLDEDTGFYELFLLKTKTICNDSPKTPDELAGVLGELSKPQLNIWLKKAVADKRLKKLTRPVRYQWIVNQQSDMLLRQSG